MNTWTIDCRYSVLKKEDTVLIEGMWHVAIESSFCFLHNPSDYNDAIFDALGIDPIETCNNVLGYYHGGAFPDCNDMEDLTRITNYLLDLSAGRSKKTVETSSSKDPVDSLRERLYDIYKGRVSEDAEPYLREYRKLTGKRYPAFMG